RVDDDLGHGLAVEVAGGIPQGPGGAAVGGDEDALAVVAVDAVVRLAGAGVDNLVAAVGPAGGIRLGDGPHEQGDRVAAAVGEVVGQRGPAARAAVGGLPDAAAGGGDVDRARVGGVGGDAGDAAADGQAAGRLPVGDGGRPERRPGGRHP